LPAQVPLQDSRDESLSDLDNYLGNHPNLTIGERMSVAVITGSAGLVGSEAVTYFAKQGMTIVGIDNGMREQFFGREASTAWNRDRLTEEYSEYHHHSVDIRDYDSIAAIFKRYQDDITLVIHTAAQPSHDWAMREPLTDFTVNANGTSVMLEATRQHAPEATFIFTSTNKVYGDRPNSLPLVENKTRWELDSSHEYSANGIPETMSIDMTLHSVFGGLEGCGGCTRAGIWPLLRPENRMFSRWLPHRPKSFWDATAWVSCVPNALRGDEQALHNIWLQRQAGTGQHS
jgi:hypothetical protein